MSGYQVGEFVRLIVAGAVIGAILCASRFSCSPVYDPTGESANSANASSPAGQISLRDFDREIAKERRRVASEIVHSLGKRVAGSARLAETSQKPEGESPEDRLKRAMSVMVAIAYQSEPGEGFNLFAVPREHEGLVESFARTLKCEMQIAPSMLNSAGYPDQSSSIAGRERAIGGDVVMRVKKRGE